MQLFFQTARSILQGGPLFDGQELPFVYLTFNYLDLTTGFTWDDFGSPRLWKELFGSSLVPHRSEVKGYCCVQLLVPRSRLYLRPKEWYQRALDWFGSAESYTSLFPIGSHLAKSDIICRTPCQLWMPWWHIVFGENVTAPKRHEDPRLPFFMQARSIKLDELVCC
mmetsp:Transcript_66369/g.151844  ORF Transcript_66369/g.151844 Transcript_66369/m.151844 type:complete len:166 (+) Transcript_66369:235-732(+)